MFYCPHALADGNQYIRIRKKTLEFSTVLSALFLYLMCIILLLLLSRTFVKCRLAISALAVFVFFVLKH